MAVKIFSESNERFQSIQNFLLFLKRKPNSSNNSTNIFVCVSVFLLFSHQACYTLRFFFKFVSPANNSNDLRSHSSRQFDGTWLLSLWCDAKKLLRVVAKVLTDTHWFKSHSCQQFIITKLLDFEMIWRSVE